LKMILEPKKPKSAYPALKIENFQNKKNFKIFKNIFFGVPLPKFFLAPPL
jgi:hypothetical protein